MSTSVINGRIQFIRTKEQCQGIEVPFTTDSTPTAAEYFL
jgi:hypothetical protein